MKKDEDREIVLINKNQGETMGQLTERVRSDFLIPPDVRVTFAGRLDPMASGLVIYLIGDKRFEKQKFIDLPKSYQFEIIFGVETDTGDALGIITKTNESQLEIKETLLRDALVFIQGVGTQIYPAYSSKHIDGKPLFEYAREGRDVPNVERQVEISSLSLEKIMKVKKDDFLKEIKEQIHNVQGDFRQGTILDNWQKAYHSLPTYLIKATCGAKVSSGTYIRVIAGDVARELGTYAIAHNIYRESVGPFTI